MVQSMSLKSALYVLAMLTVAGMQIMRRRRLRKKSRQAGAADDAPNTSPFMVPFALDAKRQVTAYQEFVPGFWIGFDPACQSVVFVSQEVNEDSTFVPSIHRYILAVQAAEPRESKWITVERASGHVEAGTSYRVSGTIVAKISKPRNLIVKFIVPQKSGVNNSLHLAAANITTDYSGFSFMESISADALGAPDRSKRSRVAIFLPLLDGVLAEIGAFDVNLEKA